MIAILCGIVTFFVTVIASVKGSRSIKLIPFVIGILAGYAVASIFTFIGMANGIVTSKSSTTARWEPSPGATFSACPS